MFEIKTMNNIAQQGLDILTTLRGLVDKESNDVASKWAKKVSSYQKKLDKIITSFEE